MIGSALLIGAPYLAIGFVWALTHTDDLACLNGAAKMVSFLATMVAWPILLVADPCAV